MLVGFVEKLISKQNPNLEELRISFRRDWDDVAQGFLMYTSSGGIFFRVPLGTDLAKPGEITEFVFDLPIKGRTRIRGEVRLSRYSVDVNQKRILIFEAKFINLSIDVWEILVDYCRMRAEGPKTDSSVIAVQRVKDDRLDFRVIVNAVKVEIKPVNNKMFRGVIEDISIGGAKVMAPQGMTIGTKATFRVRRKELQMVLNAKCAWSVPYGDVGFKTGLRFEDIEREKVDQLRLLIFKLVSEDKE